MVVEDRVLGGGVEGRRSSVSWLSPSWSEHKEGVGASGFEDVWDVADAGALAIVGADASDAAAFARQSRTSVCVRREEVEWEGRCWEEEEEVLFEDMDESNEKDAVSLGPYDPLLLVVVIVDDASAERRLRSRSSSSAVWSSPTLLLRLAPVSAPVPAVPVVLVAELEPIHTSMLMLPMLPFKPPPPPPRW